MKEKHKRVLVFAAVVIVVALILEFVLKILTSLSLIILIIAGIIVYIYWPKIKKMLSV